MEWQNLAKTMIFLTTLLIIPLACNDGNPNQKKLQGEKKTLSSDGKASSKDLKKENSSPSGKLAEKDDVGSDDDQGFVGHWETDCWDVSPDFIKNKISIEEDGKMLMGQYYYSDAQCTKLSGKSEGVYTIDLSDSSEDPEICNLDSGYCRKGSLLIKDGKLHQVGEGEAIYTRI